MQCVLEFLEPSIVIRKNNILFYFNNTTGNDQQWDKLFSYKWQKRIQYKQ